MAKNFPTYREALEAYMDCGEAHKWKMEGVEHRMVECVYVDGLYCERVVCEFPFPKKEPVWNVKT